MQPETIKLLFSVLASAVTVISYVPYIRGIRKGTIKPHSYSWFIWAILGLIAGFGQLAGGGGAGSFVALITAVLCTAIAVMGYNKVKDDITRSDTVSLIFSLAAIPLWLLTKDPLLSIILVSVIDLVGFWPTIRKAYKKPHDEGLATPILSTLKHILTILALEKYNLTTVLFPASIAVSTALYAGMLHFRQLSLPKKG